MDVASILALSTSSSFNGVHSKTDPSANNTYIDSCRGWHTADCPCSNVPYNPDNVKFDTSDHNGHPDEQAWKTLPKKIINK